MTIRTLNWYNRQITALTNAANDAGRLWFVPRDSATDEEKLQAMRENAPIGAEVRRFTDEANRLRHERWAFYRK